MAKNITPATRKKIQNSSEGTMATAKTLNVHHSTVQRWRKRDSTETLPRGSQASRERFIEDLEELFEIAMDKENLFAALKAKELLAKEQGFLKTTKIVTQFIDPSLEKLSDENLANFLALLKKRKAEARALEKSALSST